MIKILYYSFYLFLYQIKLCINNLLIWRMGFSKSCHYFISFNFLEKKITATWLLQSHFYRILQTDPIEFGFWLWIDTKKIIKKPYRFFLFFYLSGLLHSNRIIYLWLFLKIRIFQSDEEDIVKEKQVKLNVEVIAW